MSNNKNAIIIKIPITIFSLITNQMKKIANVNIKIIIAKAIKNSPIICLLRCDNI